MNPRRLAHADLPPIGLGCMNICHAYGVPPAADDAVALLRQAFDLGVRHFDTAALYGFGVSESLLARALGAQRAQWFLATKGGMAGVTGDDGVTRRVIDNSPAAIQRHCEASLQRLGTDCIDLYYVHRWDRRTPIEEVVGAMAELVRQGKVKALGLSEVSAATLRRAHAVHPIAAVQSEYSVWTREPEIAVLQTCREIGAAFVAFSPLARAFLTDTLHEVATLAPKDLRRGMPRFAPDTYPANLALLGAWRALAAEAGCTPGQLALAWLLAQGPHVHAIPGTTQPGHLAENMAASKLSLDAGLIARAGACIGTANVTGPRYSTATQAEIDTEQF